MGKKNNPAIKYREMIGAMAKVRWCVSNDRHRRPDGAVDVRILLEKLREYALADERVSFDNQLQVVSDFIGLTKDEIYYLADVGEWVEVERATAKLETEEEYEEHWKGEYSLPSMDNFYRLKLAERSPEDLDEIYALNALYYETDC